MQLLNTKLSIPPLRSKLVARSRLIYKLNQGIECGFVLVSAPAGYGKSTLLSAWLDQLGTATAWLSLDDGDNDPDRFLAYLSAALSMIDSSISEAIESPFRFHAQTELETFLTPLINHLAQVEKSFWLVLDDYHSIQNQDVHQMVRLLLEHRPTSMHLVIATRADPPLPLGRLRARAGMVELRQSDLCFTSQEAADFLDQTMGLKITSENVTHITERTEGWIAGLQIAALSLQNVEDVSGFITNLTGSHHHIFDYLLEEILEQQSPEIRRFLLYTSILDQLNAPLCETLFEGDMVSFPARSSTETLEELEHANLFILPLDQERHWYRYHHLFSDLLRLMLNKAYPDLSVELHRRACCWYEGQGMPSEALHHALSSGDMQLVAQIISANVLVLVESNEITPILEKIDSMPTDKMISLPWLGIARAWALGAGQVQKSLQILDAVEKGIHEVQNPAEKQRLKGHIAAARAFVLGAQGDDSRAIAHAREANELLPSDEIAVRAMNLTILGDLLVGSGNDPKAVPFLEQAMALTLQANKVHVYLVAAGSLANAYLFAGKLFEIQRVCLQALAVAEDYQKRAHYPLSATAEVYVLLARIHAEWGENEKAIQLAQKALRLSEHWGRINTEAFCLNYLGRALVYNNDYEQARQVLERLDSIALKISPGYWQTTTLYSLDSLLDSDIPDSLEIARQVRRLKESGASFPAVLTARLELRQDQPDEALRVLDQALLKLNNQPSFDTVRIYALRALAYQAKGDEQQALSMIKQALELAEPENRIASFVRDGRAMEKLLRLALSKSIAPTFVRRLLVAFEARRNRQLMPAAATDRLLEPLSDRETEVLKLLTQGCSDKKIAETLVIARETVHKHLKNIYGKLDVHSRTEAIRRAHELGVL